MSGQTGALTNPVTTGTRTLACGMRVAWEKGVMPDLATLQATRAIRVGATTYPTHWNLRGPRYPGGSVRFAWATWRMTLDAGVVGTITHTPTVVIADNSNISAPSFAAWLDGLSIVVSYTANEPTGNTVVSADIAALARAGTLGNSVTVRNEGGVRTIIYDAWTGPGRRHEPVRTLGHNNSGGAGNPPILRNGLLHWRAVVEARDGDSHAKVTIRQLNDAARAYPAAPHDGGARQAGAPNRPTFLRNGETNPITGLAEQRESPAIRYVSGLSIAISHASTTLHARPWYTSNHTTGAGPFGTMPTTGNGTVAIPFTHLGLFQGQGQRFSVSSTSANDAVEKAAHEWGIALPTYDHWFNYCVDSRTFVGGEVDGDEIEIRGWEVSLLEGMSQTIFDTWYDEGPADYAAFMGTTNASPWDRLGAERGPAGVGVHRHLGYCKEGEAILGCSPWHLYIYGAQALREYSCRYAQYEKRALAALDMLEGASGGRVQYSTAFNGTSRMGTSEDGFAITQFGGTNSPGAAWYNGAAAPTDNPQTGAALEDWDHYNHAHFGVRRLYIYALLTDDAASIDMLEVYGYLAAFNMPDRYYLGLQSPAAFEPRSTWRLAWVIDECTALSDDETYVDRVLGRAISRCAQMIRSGSTGFWEGGLGRANENKDPDGSACGVTPYTAGNLTGRQWYAWQNGQGVWHLLRLAMRAENEDDARDIATAVMYLCRYVVEHATMCDPAQLSTAAERAIDACWAGRVAQLGAVGSLGYPNEGYMVVKSRAVDLPASGGRIVQFLNILRDVGPSNDAQALQQSPCYTLALAFAANVARAGFTERAEFILDGIRRRFPQLTSGFEYSESTTLGYAVGDPRPDVVGNPPPVATFTIDEPSGIIPHTVELDSSGSTLHGDPEEAVYEWWENYVEGNDADETGTGSAFVTQEFTYAGPGDYRPALRITEGALDHLFVHPTGVNVRPAVVLAPIPGFTATPLSRTVGQTSQFTYIESGGRALTYAWEYKLSSDVSWTSFGAGEQNPLWTAPATAGTYDFRVTAANETAPGGVTATRSAYITVGAVTPPPTITFTSVDPTTGTIPLEVQVEVTVTYAGALGSLVVSAWANSTTATGSPDDTVTGDATPSFTFTYTSTGEKRITIKASQQDGQSTELTLPYPILVTVVPVADPPESDFSASPTSVAGSTDVALTYVDRGVRATSWAWSYRLTGAGSWTAFSTDRSPVWTSPEVDGTYDFRVIASNEFGAGAAVIKTALVTVDAAEAPPSLVVSPSATLGAYPLMIEFDATGSTLQGDAEDSTWEWYEDAADAEPTATYDGQTAGEIWEHTYELPGTYRPKLVVTQADGLFSEWVFTAGIIVTTDPALDPPAGTLTASSSTANPGEDVVVTWTDSGIPATSFRHQFKLSTDTEWTLFSTSNPATWRVPSTSGTYSLRCIAENDNGETTSNTLTVTVASGAAPVANFTLSAARFDTDAADYPTPWVRILSNDSTGDPVTHLWRLEPPGISFTGELPPAFQLPGKGTYTISLTVTNDFGSDIKSKRISVLSGTELRALWSAPDPSLLATFPGVESRLSGSWSASLNEDPNLST